MRKVITVDDVESVANIVPWLLGRTWDVNCVDIHLAHPPAATWWSRTRSRITVTYKFAFHAYSFTPVEFEITGVCGPRSITLRTPLEIKALLQYLLQKFSVAIQRRKAASIWETLPPSSSPIEYIYDSVFTSSLCNASAHQQIACMLKAKQQRITIEFRDVYQPKVNIDCGVFSCHLQVPSIVTNNSAVMYLTVRCKNKHFTVFPVTVEYHHGENDCFQARV